MPGFWKDELVEQSNATNRESKTWNLQRSCEILLNPSTWLRMLLVRSSFLKHGKDDMSLVQLGSHLLIEESLRAQESDKGKGKEVDGPSVNMIEEGGNNKNNKQNKEKKHGFKDNNGGSCSNKKPKFECWMCGKTSHFMKDYRSGNKNNNASASGSGKGSKDQSQDQDRCWFKTYEPVEDGSVHYMSDDHFAPVHGKGSVVLELVLENLLLFPNDSGSVYTSSSTVVNSSFWHACLGHVQYKRMLEMCKDDLIPAIDENAKKCSTCMLTKITRQPFKGIIYETTAPYTPQQNGLAEWKNRALKEMVNATLSNSGLSVGFWGEAMAVVRLLDPKRETLGEKESRDAIFEENCFSSIPRPNDIIPNSDESQKDYHSNDVPSETPEPHKEAIDDEIGSFMENNKWVLPDLPLGCKPFGCKWICNEEKKVDGTIDMFKARLFSMKDMGEADVILGIKNKCENKGIVITQTLYIEKILKKFNHEDCSQVSTPMDPVEKLMPNTVGRLSRFTSNPSRQHWHVITNVFKYLKGTMNYGLSYVGYPSVSEEVEFNVKSSYLEIGAHVFIFPRCKTKRTTYVSMKFCRFKKLRLGFLYSNELTGSIVKTP
ncbi:zinc finger, CCHC-type containing protein [Tanacetum coccineum]